MEGCVPLILVDKKINLFERFIKVPKDTLPKCISEFLNDDIEISDLPPERYSDEDLEKIALFINPEETQWVVKNLLNAFEFLNNFSQNDLTKMVNFVSVNKTNNNVGKFQTNENPISFSPLIIYLILIKIFGSEKINEKISLDEMIFIFRFYFCDYGTDINPDENIINTFFNGVISGLIPKDNKYQIKEKLIMFYLDEIVEHHGYDKRKKIINIENPIVLNENFYKFEKSEYEIVYEKFKNIDTNILKRIVPDNEIEAVVFGILLFQINLGFANNPLEEFSRLKMSMINNGGHFKNYVSPSDENFEKIIKWCPWFLDIRQNWFEQYHEFLYTPYMLKDFLINKGFVPVKVDGSLFWYSKENEGEYYYDSFFKALSSIGCYNSFYVGYHPFCKNGKSVISGYEFDDPEEAPDGWIQILSFGIEDNMVGYLLKDVILYFENVLKFELPKHDAQKADDVNYLSGRNINQLKHLCKRKIHDDYERLENVIKKIEGMNIKFSEYALALKESESSNCIKKGFELLLELAWYMRAWGVSYPISDGKLPLKSEDTCFDLEKEPILTLNVTNAILNLEIFLNGNDEGLKNVILNAPLMIFNKPKNESEPVKFTNVVNVDVSTGTESVVTVGEQLSIVKSGDGLVSCVRTSSNSFLASAYFYLMCLGSEMNFDIRDVDKIY